MHKISIAFAIFSVVATGFAQPQTTSPGSSPYPSSGNTGQPGNYNYNNTSPGDYNNYNNNQPGAYNQNTAPGYNPNPNRGAYQPPPGSYNTGPNTAYGQAPTGGILFSNNAGQTFSAQDLAFQLQNLRAAVDQALPTLTAFNESYSNMNNGGRQTIGGALSGIVSDVLHRNQNSTSTGTGQSFTTSNLLSALQGVLHNNNNSAAAPAGAPDPQDLIALQNDLQPVITVLQRLNVNPAYSPNPAYNRVSSPSPYPNNGLAPTGR